MLNQIWFYRQFLWAALKDALRMKLTSYQEFILNIGLDR